MKHSLQLHHDYAPPCVVTLTLLLAAAGWYIGRFLTDAKWSTALIVFAGAVLLAQGIEPVIEVLPHQRRFGYPDEPERWVAFARAIAASAPSFFACVWLCAREPSQRLIAPAP